MPSYIIAILIGIAVYLAIIALIPKRILMGNKDYTRSMLNKLSSQPNMMHDEEELSVLRGEEHSNDLLTRLFFMMPGANAIYPSLLKGGLGRQIGSCFALWLLIFFIASYLVRSFGLVGFLGAFIFDLLLARWYIKGRIFKRNDAFINHFPDALDMVVRSVRSGYPLNSAIRMVADNMLPPVSTEFKQIADEVAYGSSLIEALQRLAHRIDEPDVRFFVVVLTVQQDVGGNLSEVLQNLSNIIRKRKYLRMKVKTLASEGKATGWVLGSLPFFETALLLYVSPDHLTPLFNTHTGHILLTITLCTMGMGLFIVRQIIRIKV